MTDAAAVFSDVASIDRASASRFERRKKRAKTILHSHAVETKRKVHRRRKKDLTHRAESDMLEGWATGRCVVTCAIRQQPFNGITAISVSAQSIANRTECNIAEECMQTSRQAALHTGQHLGNSNFSPSSSSLVVAPRTHAHIRRALLTSSSSSSLLASPSSSSPSSSELFVCDQYSAGRPDHNSFLLLFFGRIASLTGRPKGVQFVRSFSSPRLGLEYGDLSLSPQLLRKCSPKIISEAVRQMHQADSHDALC